MIPVTLQSERATSGIIEVEVFTQEAADALNRIGGLDMSFERYDFICNKILKLDGRFQQLVETNRRLGSVGN